MVTRGLIVSGFCCYLILKPVLYYNSTQNLCLKTGKGVDTNLSKKRFFSDNDGLQEQNDFL